MNLIYLFLLISVSSYSCSYKKTADTIIVKGVVKNIPANKVYLTDAYNWKILQDSANYINDTFSFHINQKEFEPQLVSICFFDNTGKRKLLPFENYVLSTSDKKYAQMAFVLDKGITIISGTYDNFSTIKSSKLKIKGNEQQNDPFFKTQLSDFGMINTQDKAERKKIINNYKSLIKEYPCSYYFIKMLYEYKSYYTKEELIDILALFNNEVKHFSYTQKFSYYFNDISSPNKLLHDYVLKDSLNQFKNIIKRSSKLNMIIFWASWCKPCRQEIPKLKEIYTKFKSKGMNMVSISMDDNKTIWKLALIKERMDWQQLIVDRSLIDQIKSSYNFSDIPIIIFADKEGREITRFTGYEASNKDQYKVTIEKYLQEFDSFKSD